MSIRELIEKIKESEKTRTPEQRMRLLQEAHILNSNGELDPRFFTVKKPIPSSLRCSKMSLGICLLETLSAKELLPDPTTTEWEFKERDSCGRTHTVKAIITEHLKDTSPAFMVLGKLWVWVSSSGGNGNWVDIGGTEDPYIPSAFKPEVLTITTIDHPKYAITFTHTKLMVCVKSDNVIHTQRLAVQDGLEHAYHTAVGFADTLLQCGDYQHLILEDVRNQIASAFWMFVFGEVLSHPQSISVSAITAEKTLIHHQTGKMVLHHGYIFWLIEAWLGELQFDRQKSSMVFDYISGKDVVQQTSAFFNIVERFSIVPAVTLDTVLSEVYKGQHRGVEDQTRRVDLKSHKVTKEELGQMLAE